MVPVPLTLCLGALGALGAHALRDRTTSAHHSGAGYNASTGDYDCPCNGLALESQLARMVAISYDEKSIRSLESYAKELFSCYSWSDFYYHLPNSGLFQSVLAKVHWTTPTAFVGRCAMKPQTCTVAFSGATGLNFVAGIMSSSPVTLKKASDGSIQVSDDGTGHRFHQFYWKVYEVFREQIGDKVIDALKGCEHITITGHSIGAALAAVFQWEHLDREMQQITMGQNVAWYGKPPDVGCRGKRLYSIDDPVPYLRQFWDGPDVIRHALVPPQRLTHQKGSEKWTADSPSACNKDEPMDRECAKGCSSIKPHYNYRIFTGIMQHQASAYITAVDSAFSSLEEHGAPSMDMA